MKKKYLLNSINSLLLAYIFYSNNILLVIYHYSFFIMTTLVILIVLSIEILKLDYIRVEFLNEYSELEEKYYRYLDIIKNTKTLLWYEEFINIMLRNIVFIYLGWYYLAAMYNFVKLYTLYVKNK